MKQDRVSDALRLLKWVTANEEDWEKICGNDGVDLPLIECVRLIKAMRDEEFYEVILFILYSNLLMGIVGELLLERVMHKCKKRDIDGIIDLIIEALLREDGKVVSLQEIRKARGRGIL